MKINTQPCPIHNAFNIQLIDRLQDLGINMLLIYNADNPKMLNLNSSLLFGIDKEKISEESKSEAIDSALHLIKERLALQESAVLTAKNEYYIVDTLDATVTRFECSFPSITPALMIQHQIHKIMRIVKTYDLPTTQIRLTALTKKENGKVSRHTDLHCDFIGHAITPTEAMQNHEINWATSELGVLIGRSYSKHVEPLCFSFYFKHNSYYLVENHEQSIELEAIDCGNLLAEIEQLISPHDVERMTVEFQTLDQHIMTASVATNAHVKHQELSAKLSNMETLQKINRLAAEAIIILTSEVVPDEKLTGIVDFNFKERAVSVLCQPTRCFDTKGKFGVISHTSITQ